MAKQHGNVRNVVKEKHMCQNISNRVEKEHIITESRGIYYPYCAFTFFNIGNLKVLLQLKNAQTRNNHQLIIKHGKISR